MEEIRNREKFPLNTNTSQFDQTVKMSLVQP